MMNDVTTGATFQQGLRLLRHLRDYHEYQVYDVQHAESVSGALIFACNHSLATYDALLLGLIGWERTGRWFHAMADRLFFRLPVIKELFSGLGFVEGTRPAALELLRQGEVLGVLPGGMREALRSSRHKYRVDWRRRQGFVWLSLLSGAPIILAACPRADDLFEVADSRLTALALRHLRVPLPLFRGRGLTPIPRPVRLWHLLSEPILPEVPPDRVTERDVEAHHERLCRRMDRLMADSLDLGGRP